MTQRDTLLDEVREQVAFIEKNIGLAGALVVTETENPLEALVKIRTFLYENVSNKTEALALLMLDRAIDGLRTCEIRRTYRPS